MPSRHLATFHKSSGAAPRRCPLCAASFRAVDNLQRHLVSRHANWKRWVCSLCGHQYNHSVDLKRHLKRKHGVQLAPITGRGKKDILDRRQKLRRLLDMVATERYDAELLEFFRRLPLARPGIKQGQPIAATPRAGDRATDAALPRRDPRDTDERTPSSGEDLGEGCAVGATPGGAGGGSTLCAEGDAALRLGGGPLACRGEDPPVWPRSDRRSSSEDPSEADRTVTAEVDASVRLKGGPSVRRRASAAVQPWGGSAFRLENAATALPPRSEDDPASPVGVEEHAEARPAEGPSGGAAAGPAPPSRKRRQPGSDGARPGPRRSWSAPASGWAGGRGKVLQPRVLTRLNAQTTPKTVSLLEVAIAARSKEDKAQSRFPCCTCRKVLSSKGNLRCHLVSHTGETPFHCSACSATFRYYTNAKGHLRRHTAARAVCDVCSRSFLLPMDLRRHQRTHRSQARLSCPECPSQFSRADNLTRHRRQNHGGGASTHACPTCHSSFKTAAWLRQHLKIHTAARDEVCEVCGQRFALRAYLERHMKSHGQQRVYCGVCPRRFINLKNLMVHRETFHRNPAPLSAEETRLATTPRPERGAVCPT
ncbi:zinc finger protein 628-like [Pollicipes pollicipes]|uniref:zinc finger protein 628-like n=1 Tax=Pollicipes pollicipes TaxID=41117 RepID=UPI0018856BB9|nr:zinc finger protein 628-like [Pollicipes pollicipes]